MLTGLAPLVSGNTRLLILGSFPGVASLAAQQYYGHPQNRFWKILQAIWPSCAMPTGTNSYKIRSEWLLDRGLGLWDVYAACEREGSLDSRIRKPQVNDFSPLLCWCPDLQAIAHNGGESFRQAQHVSAALTTVASPLAKQGPQDRLCRTAGAAAPSGSSALHEVKSVGVLFHKLPSTSPANASWSFDRKLAAWREVFEAHGLTDKQ
ncbi:G:T/U mismatch-specific uracil/thymine DNA-glycosylase [Polaromonas sp. CG9_12]|nr:G:T/U mismatch-specific uracil/thymine DNA-glycosylase [Polaromonas sp. CG9_12]